MDGTCSACGGDEWRIQDFGGKNLRERDLLVNTDVDGRIISRWVFRKWDVGLWTGSS